MAKLSPEDAISFYKRFYAPNNAILVVTGDITPEELLPLAEATYGKIPANPEVTARSRPQEPPHLAARRIDLKDPRAGKPSFHRYYLAPSYSNAEPGEAEALDLLLKVLASGSTSRAYKKLVIDDQIAASTGGYYSGAARDSGKIAFYAVPVDGVGLDKVEAALDKVIADVRANGIDEAELDRAKKSYLAEYIYQSDNQATLARRYGWSLTVGRTVKDIEEWPDRIAKVTAADTAKVAAKYLDIRRSVTGTLEPESPDAAGTVADTPASAPAATPAAAPKAGGRS